MQFQLAEARWRRNEVEPCRATLEEIVANNASHRGAHLRLAEVYLLRNQPHQALSLLRRFCRTNSEDADAHHLLGMSYEALGQGDRALAAYDMAAELDPSDPILLTSLENALAAREGAKPQFRLKSETRDAIAKGHGDKEILNLPPETRPAASSAPRRLPLLDAPVLGSAAGGSHVQIVPVEIAASMASDEHQEPDASNQPDKSAASASEAASNDPSVPADLPRRSPGSPSQEPARWAYELEVSDLMPSSEAESTKNE
jgi:tetratricopeptide (TPR) repeat protein